MSRAKQCTPRTRGLYHSLKLDVIISLWERYFPFDFGNRFALARSERLVATKGVRHVDSSALVSSYARTASLYAGFVPRAPRVTVYD